MNFRTVVDIPAYNFHLGHEQDGLLVGSCFAVSIGERLNRRKMPVTVNPFGVTYNPVSVIQTLQRIEKGNPLSESDLYEHNGLWFSFFHHSSLSSPDRTEALEKINRSIEIGQKALIKSNYLILTLGTAWVYEWIESGDIVNNCHKIPERKFRRLRLCAGDIVNAFHNLFDHPLYKDKKIILTVSPVRHLKDGAIENQLSKAILLTAVHQLAEQYENVCYFPSYEIMMDDLRDYRFYAADMIHPSETAVDYIWERFCDAFVCESSQKLFKRIEKINAACRHRPFNPDTQQHRTFKNAMLAETVEVQNQYPHLDFSEEICYFSR